MPWKDAANWTAHPEDLTHALQFLLDQKSRGGNGGNFDKTTGGPKTAESIMAKWKEARKLHEYVLQAKQKGYPGASGWTYTDELGFNVTDDDRDAWRNFSKAHMHFKPFAMCGWIHFKTADKIIPSLARGHYVFHGGATQPAESATAPPEQSQDDDTEQRSDNSQQRSNDSQPFSDWSQTNYGESQPPNVDSQPSQSTVAHHVPTTISATLASALKRVQSDTARLLGAISTPGPQVPNQSLPLVALLMVLGR
ncbi:hypothetical protein B0H10DRAFT_2438281 [Mycena sp. CBHHK59/15]|nr:hypothetical protein B0H10DRAFT_2438281 [Mycena sp. CBHHK59/15]